VVTRHMQACSSGLSPRKACASPTRLGPSAPGSRGPLCGSSPATFRQPSRLSVSQSWLAASPGHTPRRGASMAGCTAQLQETVTEAACGAVCESVRARLFGPGPGAVIATLQPAQQQPAAPVAQEARAAAAGASDDVNTSDGPFGSALLPRSLTAPQQAAVQLCSSTSTSSSYDGLTRQPSMLPMGGAAVGQLQDQLHLASLPVSPAAAKNRALLCTSRVAQVLFGTPSAKPASMTGTQTQQHGSTSTDAVDAVAGQQGHLGMAAAAPSVAGCSSSRHGGAAGSAATGSSCDTCDSDSDYDDDVAGPQWQEAAGHAMAAGKENRGGPMSHSKRGGHSRRKAPVLPVGCVQQPAAECWTVHTNWAADLDTETEAVATAAAAAAGLSAQLGRGSAVRLQEHASTFMPAAGGLGACAGVAGQPMQAQVAGCSPMWVSAAAGQLRSAAAEEAAGKAAAAEEARAGPEPQDVCTAGEVLQHPPCVCSPMQLMVPRRLWRSPGGEGA
jgi:hypothetical protein